jgi:hypothetical protein
MAVSDKPTEPADDTRLPLIGDRAPGRRASKPNPPTDRSG